MKDFHEVQNWILGWLERELRVPAIEIATDENLLNYGMDSINAIMLVGDLENELQIRLSPTLLWDHPSVNALANVVVSQSQPVINSQQKSKQLEAQSPDSTSLSQQEAAALLENIDQLSDHEINELLDRLAQE